MRRQDHGWLKDKPTKQRKKYNVLGKQEEEGMERWWICLASLKHNTCGWKEGRKKKVERKTFRNPINRAWSTMRRYHHGNHWFLPTSTALRSEFLPPGTHQRPGCHSLHSYRSWLLAQLWASLQLSWAISATQLPPQASWPPCLHRGHFISLETFSPYWPGELWPLWEKHTFYVRLFLAHTGNHPCLYATFISSVFDSCIGVIICLQYSFPHKKMNFVQPQTSFLSVGVIWLAQGLMHAKIIIVIIHTNKWLSLWVPTWMKSCLNEFGFVLLQVNDTKSSQNGLLFHSHSAKTTIFFLNFFFSK